MKYFTLIVLLALCTMSCKKDEVTAKNAVTEPVQTIVTGVNGPVSGTINQELSFTLLWPNAGSRHFFDHVVTTALPFTNTQYIKLYTSADTAAVARSGRQLSAVYKFKAATAGTYYLKFSKPSNDSTYSIIDTIVIK